MRGGIGGWNGFLVYFREKNLLVEAYISDIVMKHLKPDKLSRSSLIESLPVKNLS